jgi:lysophospholipase L1-like esterase
VLNARDMAQQRRGYYEELDVGRKDNWGWQGAEQPEGWSKGLKVFYRQRSDFMLTDIAPSVSTFLEGAPIRSNSLGMRDREYDKIKPPNTYRIVLLGASHEQGSGVKEDETYENVVEDRLNRELPNSHYSRYEILNMSVGMSGLFQRLLRLEEQGFQFEPDAVILAVGAADKEFLFRHLSRTLSLGIEPPPDYRQILERVTHSAGIHGKMPVVMIERRLQPYFDELYEWAFQRFAQQCKQRGIHPLVIYRPAPLDFDGSEQAGRTEVIGLARAAGLEVLDLSPAFDSVADRSSLILAKWDHHTTARGHRLLADKLYEGLVPLLFGSSH